MPDALSIPLTFPAVKDPLKSLTERVILKPMRAIALCLLLAASAAAESLPAGEGAQRLVGGAVKEARRRFHADACLAGIRIDLGELCESEKGRIGLYNRFEFIFYSAEHPMERYSVEINDQTGPADCASPPMAAYKGRRGSVVEDSEPSCLAEMSLDSEGAVGIAALSGLADEPVPPGRRSQRVFLRRAADENSAFWKFPALRGKTFWDVVAYFESARKTRTRNVVIDAKDGKVLLVNRPLPLE